MKKIVLLLCCLALSALGVRAQNFFHVDFKKVAQVFLIEMDSPPAVLIKETRMFFDGREYVVFYAYVSKECEDWYMDRMEDPVLVLSLYKQVLFPFMDVQSISILPKKAPHIEVSGGTKVYKAVFRKRVADMFRGGIHFYFEEKDVIYAKET